MDIAFDRTSQQFEYDCEKRTERLLAVRVYNDTTGADAAPRGISREPVPVAPETYGELQLEQLCRMRPGMPVARADTTVGRVADAWPMYRTLLGHLQRGAAAAK